MFLDECSAIYWLFTKPQKSLYWFGGRLTVSCDCLRKNESTAAQIHHELCLVYRPTLISEGRISGCTNVHDEGRSGRLSTQTGGIVQVDQKLWSDPRLVFWYMNFLMDGSIPRGLEKPVQRYEES